jgi:hypothetical protein
LDDRRHLLQTELGPAYLPVVNARLVDAELLRDLSLQQLERKAPAQ